MFKSLFLPLIAVAGFIVLVGVFLKNPNSLGLSPDYFSESNPAKTITVGQTQINVFQADTETKRAKGLSGREALGDMEGMLFVFDKKDIQTSFWMKDMIIPIDIIWINDGLVVKIDKNVLPPLPNTPDSSLPLFRSGILIDYVLEVNAGFSDKNNIKVGSPVNL